MNDGFLAFAAIVKSYAQSDPHPKQAISAGVSTAPVEPPAATLCF